MTAILIPPGDEVSAASAVVLACGRASTGSAAVSFDDDPFVEAPIEFVPGIEAHPSRESQPEPSGSGPFGF
jgi:hypothetical protein